MKVNDMPLFRGFSFEIIGGTATTINNDNNEDESMMVCDNNTTKEEVSNTTTSSINNKPLMLKMKLLPYMIRTFGCRNGLKSLRKRGMDAYIRHCQSFFSNWDISKSSQEKWRPFLLGWGEYARRCIDSDSMMVVEDENELPPLSESYYLDHLDRFESQYLSGKFRDVLSMSEANCIASGLVVVVSPTRDTACKFADNLANELGGATRLQDLNKVNADLMLICCQKGRCHVCSAIIENGYGSLRKLLKEYADFISVILYKCSDQDVQGLLLPQKSEKKLLGMRTGWRNMRCSRVVELTEKDEVDQVKDFITQLNSKSQKDDDKKPGLLIFFPGIPGCGKSVYSFGIKRDMRVTIENNYKRNLIVQVGDETNEKFWPLVKRTRLQDSSCIYIADKNAPVGIWDVIGEICTCTNALPVAIIPDSNARRTTSIYGIRKHNEILDPTEVHIYPFSLPYLAVCISRVLARSSGSHIGKLDSSTPRACMVVIKIFSLYRSLSADDMLVELKSQVGSCVNKEMNIVVEVPFFKENHLSDAFPRDLKEVLIEALQFQLGCDRKKINMIKEGIDNDQNDYIDELESRLRGLIEKHHDLLLDLTVEESESYNAFLSALETKLKELENVAFNTVMIEKTNRNSSFKLASIDVDVHRVHDILAKSASEFDDNWLSQVFHSDRRNITDILLQNGNSDLDIAKKYHFVTNTHVTMAHCSEISQHELRSIFTPLLGLKVELYATAILWNERIMALAVTVPNKTTTTTTNNDGIGKSIPAIRNNFSHITAWCNENVKAKESNDLPNLVQAGKAKKIDFDTPILLNGTISLWDDSKDSFS